MGRRKGRWIREEILYIKIVPTFPQKKSLTSSPRIRFQGRI